MRTIKRQANRLTLNLATVAGTALRLASKSVGILPGIAGATLLSTAAGLQWGLPAALAVAGAFALFVDRRTA